MPKTKQELEAEIREVAVDRHADLMRQGFMRPRREPRAKVALSPMVACEWCQNWHRQGKHTRSGRVPMGVVQRAIG